MAQITIGVPVYNGERYLQGSLECLSAQTFADFTAIIFDNASTDATARIAQAHCARDPRFSYVRQPRNVGSVANFWGVLKQATTPYFLWRAADDRSAPDYVETLHRLLEARPDKDLAFSRIISTFEGATIGEDRVPKTPGDDAMGDRLVLMFQTHPSIFYGLYRRPAIEAVMDRVVGRYSINPWAWDYLVLLPFMLDAKIIGTDETEFYVELKGPKRPKGARRGPRVEADFDEMMALRRGFLKVAHEFTDPRFEPGAGRLFAEVLLWVYANKRVYKFKHILRRSLRRAIGLEAPNPDAEALAKLVR